MRIVLVAGFFFASVAFSQTPIHQCKDADGNVVYSQLPCKDEEPASEKEAPEEVEAPVIPGATLIPAKGASRSDAPSEPASDEETAACKKRYRDAIDAIDAEIRLEYTPEKDAEYKQRLLALTRQLRAC